MTPLDGTPPAPLHPALTDTLPASLKLEFSKAADYGRIDALFEPAVKEKLDPGHYVYKRLEAPFRRAVESGAVALLSGDGGAVRTMTIAYRAHKDENADPAAGPFDFSEFGTGLASLGGYKSAMLVMTALALREWWAFPPKDAIVNDIALSNAPSVAIYRDRLGWEEVTDPARLDLLYNVKYRSVAVDSGNGVGKPPPAADRAGHPFFVFTDKALAIHARALLDFMDQGGVLNRKTGHHIPVDFSALDAAGLTRPMLEAMAQGVTDRVQLQAFAPPKTTPGAPAP